MREIDTLLADMLNDVCTLLKVIDRKLEEILRVLYIMSLRKPRLSRQG